MDGGDLHPHLFFMKEDEIMKNHILGTMILNKPKEEDMKVEQVKKEKIKDTFVEVTEKFYMYYVMLNNEQRGCIYLTENQAYSLNKLLKIFCTKNGVPILTFQR